MKQLLLQMIQNFQKWAIPKPYPRSVEFPDFPENIRKAFVLMGIRRSGKTWILYEVMQKLLAQGVSKKQMLYINFEDDRLSSFKSEDFETLLQAYFELYPEYADRSDIYFFLDEVHVVDGWEKFVRRLIDQEKVQIYVTGSSAKMLSRELATTLRGRAFTLEVFPFSFHEFLDTQNVDEGDSLSSKQQSTIRHHCRHYLQYGGFPETLDLPVNLHRPLLQDYMNTVVFRDVIERHRFSNSTIAKLFFLRCMRQLGGRLSVRKLFRGLKSEGQSVGINSLYELLDYFEEAYALFPVTQYTFSLKQQQTSPKKIYAVDPGILRAYSVKPGFDDGASLENAVFIQLRRFSTDIFYYTTNSGREVDFVVLDSQGSLAIYQACFDLADPQTLDREIAALVEASEELELSGGTIITWDQKEQIVKDGFTIHCIPFWEWTFLS